MLEVHQNNDLSNYKKLLSELGLDKNDVKLLEAYDNGNVTGYLIYSCKSDTVVIYFIDFGSDLNLADGLIRTALFKASLIGTEKAEFKGCSDTAKRLGFLKGNSNLLDSIQSVMGGCCNCKKIC